MLGRFFRGEKGQLQPGISSSEDEYVVAGEIVNKHSSDLEKRTKMVLPLLDGLVGKVERMGFQKGDRIEIERGGKKQEGSLDSIVPQFTEVDSISSHSIYLSIKLKDSGEYIGVNLEDVISGQVKIKKIA